MKKTLIQTFGKQLKELRKEKGLTLREVESKSKISNAYLSQIERGKRGIPTLKILIKLSEVYGVPTADLLEKADTSLLPGEGSIIFEKSPTQDSQYVSRAYDKLSEGNKVVLKKFLQYLLKDQK
jgi:transcriptional regulator with XRE-family HTH domain